MKKILLILFTIGMFFCFLFCSTQKGKQQYNYNTQYHNNESWDLSGYLYKGNEQYYKSIEDFFILGNYDSADLSFFKRQMIDPYLDDKQTLKYIPIYDETSTYPIACIFLSAGEDGVYNNDITQKLHLNNWYKVIKAYNLDEVKKEIDKFSLRYPMFNRKNNHQGWRIIDVDESVLSNKNIVLRGDSLFRDNFIFDIMDELSNPRKPFVYQKYSIFRKILGKKDYIVDWGCRVIEYEIVK